MDAHNDFDDDLLAGNLLAHFQTHVDEPSKRPAPHPMNVQALLSEGGPPQSYPQTEPQIQFSHELTPPRDENAMSDDDLLAQFQADTDRFPHEPIILSDEGEGGSQGQNDDENQVQPPANEPMTEPSPKKSLSKKSQPKWTVRVEVPKAINSHEFEDLPGHSELDRVLGEVADKGNTLYRIELGSGEVVTVPYFQLLSYSNGEEALDEFSERRNRGSLTPLSDAPGMADISESSAESSAQSSARSASVRRSRRATNAPNYSLGLSYNVGNGRDDDSSSDDPIKLAMFGPKRRLRRGRRQESPRATRQPKRAAKDSDEESEYGQQGIRFSTRQRKTVRKSLREKLEDDISENEVTPREKKFYGAREVFPTISSKSPFRQCHLDSCDVCGLHGDDRSKGPLVFCQGCTVAYHQPCLGPRSTREHLATRISDNEFILQCRRCLGVANAKDSTCPHTGCCTDCRKKGPMSRPLRERLTPRQEQQLRQDNDGRDPVTPIPPSKVNNVDNVLFRCTVCHRGFHFEHLPSLYDDSEDVEDVAAERAEEYSSRWQCKDCMSVPGEVGTMVAWRPNDPQSFISDYTADVMEEADKDYLIKWRNKSHYHTTWMAGTWVWGYTNPAMRRAFFKSSKNSRPFMTNEEAIPEDFLRVDIVFDVHFSNDLTISDGTQEADVQRVHDVTEAYVKFKGLPYEDAVWQSTSSFDTFERWNDFQTAYEAFVWRDYVHTPDPRALQRHLFHVRQQPFAQMALESQPDTMTGGQIMDYQKDGLNWLYYMWYKRQNAILADEMGLGKTMQVIGFFATLIQYHKCWPFLVVVPNSTCPNWRKEIKQWAPSIRVVTYYGSAFSRKLAHDHEMFSGKDRDLRCHVVVTSYEVMIDDTSRKALARVPWAGLVIDEGQRLKNDKSQLYEVMSRIKFPFKVLLTGTPLQNNTRELFNILHFCDPSMNQEKLEREYGILSKENIPQLHELIRPFFLRRTKNQVLTFLPPIAQIIVPVSMTVLQKKLYKSILAKNPLLIKAIFQRAGGPGLKQTERQNLNNILMQLRKCLCHPFVYSKAIEEHTSNPNAYHRHLVEAAGKFQLLQLMLPKLQSRGHRVLIFSQFLENLDLIEDFLDGLGVRYRRLDGRMSSLEKQKQIDDYNAHDSPYFAFLLSTRSGGIGINLASADTVLIMDPDFNPHQDMQALSRAHRIGQKSKVLVFQLVTRGSAEERILQIGKKKMVLDHVLIDRMISEEDDGRDLESVLRHGAQALFEDDDSGDVHYDSESVDKLLDRSQEEQAKTPDEAGESQFGFARVWANDNQNMEQLQETSDTSTPNNTVWDKILYERETAAAEEARRRAETFGRGKRKRNAVDYVSNIADISPERAQKIRNADSDGEFRGDDGPADESSSSDAESLGVEEVEELPPKKIRSFERADPENPPQSKARSNGIGMDRTPERIVQCYVCIKEHPFGRCPLKLAGAEHCNLCGIAHYGNARTCPHLRSEVQVSRMLDALKHSDEPREIVEAAKKYAGGIKGSLGQEARRKEATNAARLASSALAIPSPPSSTPNQSQSSGPPQSASVVDLTGS